MKLIKSELLKIRTINTWWIFALIYLPLWGLTLMINYFQTDSLLKTTDFTDWDPEQVAEFKAIAEVPNVAANLYTNGQFFGVLVAMLFGIIVVTNEFFHQTATTTFLTTPHRTAVILAKLGAASIIGVFFWLFFTVLNLVLGAWIMSGYDLGSQLTEGVVWQSIGLNGLAYLLWAIFGVGFGVLIRSQIGATVTAIVLYFVGYIGPAIFFATLADRFGDWVQNLQVLIPALASQLMVAATELPNNPPQWLGAVVLIGYALVTGIVGTLIVRKRDIA